jgi:ABC-type branched-subunit amino acid transport system ATPase component/ABC-type branched-subunit amino acid transport system permease subunit
MTHMSKPPIRTAASVVGGLVTWAVAAALLPKGLPTGVVLQGVVLGGLSSLTAMGLVLVYRASRIFNFAQAEIGGLAASTAVVMVAGAHLPYALAVPVGLAVAAGTGWLIDATVVRRFFTAPRLIFTVATLGLAQILGGAQLALPSLFGHLDSLTTFHTPFKTTFFVAPLLFTGDHVTAMIAVPLVFFGLGWFFARSDAGIAIRAAADSSDRALLLGIPVRRLSRITWILAAVLSGLAALLSAPILGPNVGVIAGPVALLPPLAAAVIGRMENLPTTVAASLGIGVMTQAIFWNSGRSSTVDVALFVLILAALLLQRREVRRVDGDDLGSYVASHEVRRLTPETLAIPTVRRARILIALAVGAALIVVPLASSNSTLTLFSFMAIYAILGVSLVVLTGWAGQISLGQFAFAGIGASTTASLLVHAHADYLVALLAAAAIGGVGAVVVGVPALRTSGPFLAAATLALGVPVSTYLLNATYFPKLVPEQFERPLLLHHINLAKPLTFYYFCLAFLAVVLWLSRNYRMSRAGRAAVAARDNARAAAGFSISPAAARLTAFAFSGALAGLAGGLYVVGLRGLPFSGFPPINSLVVFSMVVIGGLTSLPGALLGALYVQGAQYFLHGSLKLFATGAGLLVLLMVLPGGLGEVLYRVRDRLFMRLADRAGRRPTDSPTASRDATPGNADRSPEPAPARAPARFDALLSAEGVHAAYGAVPVLFDVNVDVEAGEILGLLGTNGAGKSTLLRVFSGLLHPTRGRVVFDGTDITAMDPIERVRAGLVTVPGGHGVFTSLTVEENLRMAAWTARTDRVFIESTRARVLQLFPALAARLDDKAGSLSGGEQQMLTVGQALFCRPKVLLIDELSLGLAPAVVSLLLDVVRQLREQGTTVVVVEQSVNVAINLAGRAVFMEKGEVRFTGPTANLVNRPDLLRAVFLGAPHARRRQARPNIPATAPARLETRGVSRRFGGVEAVSAVDLNVRDGEILGVIGANGAGKTTLFDICSGFLSNQDGDVMLDGASIGGLSAHARSWRGLGRVFQDARLFPSMTVRETLAVALERHADVRDPMACILGLGAAVKSEREIAERVDDLLDLLNLRHYADSFTSELSTGTRRIVELGCAVAHRPSVLLLDEPSSGLAQRETEALAGVLLDLRDKTGASLIVIEHDIPLLTQISDRMVCPTSDA